MKQQTVLVLGAAGMLGHAVFKSLREDNRYCVYGTVRSLSGLHLYFSAEEQKQLIAGVDINQFDSLLPAFGKSRPDVVINCIGLIKQLPAAQDYVATIELNALFPHKLARLCAAAGARLIHMSTDCVFNGEKGRYRETDLSDAEDLYGKTKYLGEVIDSASVVTIRTSIIGHELKSNLALVDWFLSQPDSVRGYSKVIYTGLTTYELARVMMNVIIPDATLQGLYQVAAEPISKYDLLTLFAKVYHKKIAITEFPDVVSDRSLVGQKFQQATGYVTPSWPQMVEAMYQYFCSWDCYRNKFDHQYRK